MPQLPNTEILSSIIADGFALAIVAYAISVSLAKMYGVREGYTIDSNQVGENSRITFFSNDQPWQ